MNKSVKIILIVVGVLMFAFSILIAGIVIDDLKMEGRLNKIVEGLASEEVINMKIETTGDYAKVEKMIKTDYNDFYKLVDKVINEYGNPIIANCLSARNYDKDGPEFINTKAELEQLKIKRKEINDKMLDIVSSKNIELKIKENKLSDYYVDLYKEYTDGLRILIKDVIREDESFNETIDGVIEILDFLTSKKDHWTIEEENIVFDDQDILDKYNWLVDKICADCKKEDLPNV